MGGFGTRPHHPRGLFRANGDQPPAHCAICCIPPRGRTSQRLFPSSRQSSAEAPAFLRILRTVRLLYTYQLLAGLRRDSPWFRRNEEVVFAVVNLSVFIFIMTGIVYETQQAINPQIHNYADALYFTITALTTTGFGDITLQGTLGRLISVVIMILGVTLFFNLARALLRPHKVRFPCPDCGLQRHDPDAVHCKACGRTLNIPDEGT